MTPTGSLPDTPSWTTPQRAAAVLLSVVATVVVAVLATSYGTLSALEEDLREANQWADEYVDLTRLLGRVELALATADGVDDPAVVDAVALTRRPLQLAVTRAEDHDQPPELDGLLTELGAAVDRLETLAATAPAALDEARTIAADAETWAKAGADIHETSHRARLNERIGELSRLARGTGLLAGLVVVASVLLLVAVRRRFRSAYAVAYGLALEHARELERSNAELVAANETKERFVSMVSHELRTPLTVIRGFAETLAARWDHLPPNRRAELVDGVIRQAQRQQRMVDDLLAAARAAQDPPAPAPSRFRLDVLVERLVTGLVDTTDRRLVLEPSPACQVVADPGHTEQVLENLLTNALKYGGSTCWVSWTVGRRTVEVRVADDGDGVEPAFVDAMFEPFSQADSGDTRSSRGVGLGLSITRTLAAANNGTVRYEERDGGGAVFVVELPLARDEPARAAAPVADAAHDAAHDAAGSRTR